MAQHHPTECPHRLFILRIDVITSDFAGKTKVDSRFIKLIRGLSITHVDWQLIKSSTSSIFVIDGTVVSSTFYSAPFNLSLFSFKIQ